MSYVKIWVHLVFSTKYRDELLATPAIRQAVHKHIIENCKQKGIFLQAVNGYSDHIHCLISLGKEQNIAQVSQLIKGESSFWMNKNNIVPTSFAWQDDYFAVSVSQSHVERVVNYIKNQERHHSSVSLAEEVDEFVNKYGFQLVDN